MKIYRLKVAVLLFILAPVLAFAETIKLQTATPAQPSLDLQPYIEFALEWTSYSYKGEALPVLKIEKHSLVQVYAYGDLEYAQAEYQGIKLPTVNAIYLVDKKTIYISDKIELNDPKTQLTIIHEVVHYLQDINGYTQSLGEFLVCTESEAYDVQMLWQKIKKIDEESIPFVYQQSLLAATRCMGNKYNSF
jgi:hypothetical protein